MIAGVVGEDFMGEGKDVTIDHKVDEEPFAVGTFITRVAAFGFRIAGAQALNKYVEVNLRDRVALRL